MKKLLSLFVLATVLLSVGFASAGVSCGSYETTFVSGVITDATNGNALVNGANVAVTCNGNVKNTLSNAFGEYQVQYTTSECPLNSVVSVSASWNGLNGNSNTVDWYTENDQVGCLALIVNVACADVPLVPEFGTWVGVLTALGALGVFFVVRRK